MKKVEAIIKPFKSAPLEEIIRTRERGAQAI